MVEPIEEIRREVLSLLATVSSTKVRYRFREIDERLADAERNEMSVRVSRSDSEAPY
jgi:hypothetical protein